MNGYEMCKINEWTNWKKAEVVMLKPIPKSSLRLKFMKFL